MIELAPEGVEAVLLSFAIGGRGPDRLGLQGGVHALVAAILLRLARLGVSDILCKRRYGSLIALSAS